MSEVRLALTSINGLGIFQASTLDGGVLLVGRSNTEAGAIADLKTVVAFERLKAQYPKTIDIDFNSTSTEEE